MMVAVPSTHRAIMVMVIVIWILSVQDSWFVDMIIVRGVIKTTAVGKVMLHHRTLGYPNFRKFHEKSFFHQHLLSRPGIRGCYLWIALYKQNVDSDNHLRGRRCFLLGKPL